MPSPVIAIEDAGLVVEAAEVAFPIPSSTLVEWWGEPERWEGRAGAVLTWHALGIYAHAIGGDHVKTLCLQLQAEPDAPAFRPRSLFRGECRVDGAAVADVVAPAASGGSRDRAIEAHGLLLHPDRSDGSLVAVEISSATRVVAPVPADRYLARSVPDPVAFADLNLKLAVVNELMYEKESLTPRFDLGEFVRWFDGRPIDPDAEGHRPVPEALAWFDRLEVDRSLVETVRELVVDAGNEVYLAIAPQWDGEDDTFDVGTWDDVALLPALERIDFISMTPSPAVVEALRARGLDVVV